jgi:hypothetical protein
MNEVKEIRYINAELRVGNEPDSREITGRAIVFNSESELLGDASGHRFREIIKPESVSDELLRSSDIVMLYNHDNSQGILARNKRGTGSLKVWKTDQGVNFSFRAKKTALGEEILQSVREGDLDSCSFGFTLTPNTGSDKWTRNTDGTYTREISKFSSLFDMSIVQNPAYTATECSTRGIDDLLEQEQKEMQRLEELRNYYIELKKEYSIKK